MLLCLLAGRKPNFQIGHSSYDDEHTTPSSPSRSNGMSMEDRYGSMMGGKTVLELAEPQFYRGLLWVRDNNVTGMWYTRSLI